MKVRLWLRAAAIAPLGALLPLAAGVAPVGAHDEPECHGSKTSHATFTNHDDGGHPDVWAKDNFQRTVKICQTTPSGDPAGAAYHAVLRDEGSFTTIATKTSPRGASTITAAVTGHFEGGFTADFVAPGGFTTYTDFAHGQTFIGAGPVKSSDWVKNYFTPATFNGSSINNDWSWKYRTCAEHWTDAFPSDGTLVADGDITGKACKKSDDEQDGHNQH